jgi:hypothetical protein
MDGALVRESSGSPEGCEVESSVVGGWGLSENEELYEEED